MYKSPDEEIQAELADELGVVELKHVRDRLPAVLSRPEVRALIAAPSKERDRLLLRTLYATGMRSGEACNLRWCDVCSDNSSIFIRLGKGEKDRYVGVDPETLAMLQEWRGSKPLDAKIFGLTTVTVGKIYDAAGLATGILEKYVAMNRIFSPHAMRHTYATHMYENGAGLVDLQLLLGHVFIDTTRLYIHVGIAHTLREYQRRHPLCAPLSDAPHGDAGAQPGVSTGLHCHDGQEG